MSSITVPSTDGLYTLPRYDIAPEATMGNEYLPMAEAAASVGLGLDAHQHHIMRAASGLREAPAGRTAGAATWAASQVGVTEPRQNGKSRTLLARTVAGILYLEEPKIIHSAHEVKTAMESYRALRDLCLNYDVLGKLPPAPLVGSVSPLPAPVTPPERSWAIARDDRTTSILRGERTTTARRAPRQPPGRRHHRHGMGVRWGRRRDGADHLPHRHQPGPGGRPDHAPPHHQPLT